MAINGVFVFNLDGLSYGRFSWKVWAQVYNPQPGTDSDGDGILDGDDPNPMVFDPSGCFYDTADGRIVDGGLITPNAPGNVTVALDGSNGCYQFEQDSAGTASIEITVPPGCAIAAASCPVTPGTLDVMGLTQLGNLEDAGNVGFLEGGGACTVWYTSMDLMDPADLVIGNNIPLVCPEAGPAPAPAMSGRGLVVVLAALLLIAGVGLQRRRRFNS